MSIFQRINSELGVTVVLVTHDPHRARQTRRVIRVRDGRIVEDLPVPGDQFLPAGAGPPEDGREGLPA